MGNLSDDESSDSSNEFLVPAAQLDLNSSFFEKQETKKPSPKKKVPVVQDDSDESDDDFDYVHDDNEATSAELLSQVLKNLENVQNQYLIAEARKSEASTSNDAKQEVKGDDLSNEISNLLLQGESAATLSKNDNENENEDSKVEVKQEYSIPDKGVQIHLPGENVIYDKNKKKKLDIQKLLQNKINHRIRTTQVLSHKVGLLTWLAHGFHLNKLANNSDIMKVSLSLVSSNNYPKSKIDLKYVEKFTKWFVSIFKIPEENKEVVFNKDLLMKRISDKKIQNYVELILLYIAAIRGMGIHCRLVISLQPPRLKPKPEQLFRIVKKDDTTSKSAKEEKNDKIKTENGRSKETKSKITPVKAETSKGKGRGKGKSKQSISPTKTPENSREASKIANEEARRKAAAILKGKTISKSLEDDTEKRESKIDQTDEKNTRKSIQKGSIKKMKKEDTSDGDDDDDDDDEEEEDKIKRNTAIASKLSEFVRKKKDIKTLKPEAATRRSSRKVKNSSKTNKLSRKRKHSSGEEYSEEESVDSEDDFKGEDFESEESDFSTDDDFVDEKPKKKTPKRTPKQAVNKRTPVSKSVKRVYNSRKIISSDENNDDEITDGYNYWIEVYVDSEKSWISVNILDQKVHCVSELYKKASNPVLYVIAWNSNGTLKDVTRRYCAHWLTDTRKKRVDEKWWSDTLSNWNEGKTAMSKAEDEQLLQRELEQPLPKTVGECKGHPLYVLTRHLLKFEALYPPDAAPLGHLKTGEAIYSRYCVHTLRSRETWVKQARVVKPSQEPYKLVKSLPKYDKLSGQVTKGQPLELFGKWQTSPYVPPEAKDGKIPRNEYGNVDLFKMCMLPKGTAYINLPGLNRIARKLGIDCAPACVGFNFGCRGALPAFEGFVVCEEYEDVMRDAWEKEQIEAEKRNKEKREKRIYGNWKKLIKGLIIREKLAAKYNFGDEQDETVDDQERVIKIPKEIDEKKKKATSEKKKSVPTKEKSTSVKKKSLPEKEKIVTKTEKRTSVKEKSSPEKVIIVTKEEESAPAVGKISPEKEKNVSIGEENAPVVEKDSPKRKKSLRLKEENTSAKEKKTAAKKEVVPEPKMATRASKRTKQEPANPNKKVKR